MINDYEIIKLFSLITATSHLSNKINDKKATAILDCHKSIIAISNNTENFTTIENIIINFREKSWDEYFIFTNDLFNEKELYVISQKKIKKIYIVTPNNKIKKEKIKEFTKISHCFHLNIEFISLKNKDQLILNIIKDEGIDFLDSTEL